MFFFGYEGHFVLDMIALAMMLYIAAMGTGLWRALPNRKDTRFLALYGWVSVGFQFMHTLAPEILPAYREGLFYPLTWFAADIVTLPLLFAFVAHPARLSLVTALSIVIGSLACVTVWIAGAQPHHDGVFGRPQELLVTVTSLWMAVWIICKSVRMKADDAAGVFVVAALLLQAAASLAMAVSHALYDGASVAAHMLQVTAFLPFCALLRKALR